MGKSFIHLLFESADWQVASWFILCVTSVRKRSAKRFSAAWSPFLKKWPIWKTRPPELRLLHLSPRRSSKSSGCLQWVPQPRELPKRLVSARRLFGIIFTTSTRS